MPLRPRSWLSTALTLPLLFLLPTWGDTPDAPPLGACYMGFGKMLESAQSRQLSLNAHVSRFLYQPGGLEIAYEGAQKDGDEVTNFIRLAGVRRGATTTLVSTTAPVGAATDSQEQDAQPYRLAGWSGDGRYLLIRQEKFVTTPVPNDNYFSDNYQCIDVGADPIRAVPVSLPDTGIAGTDLALRETRFWWSPDRTHLLFAMQAIRKEGGTIKPDRVQPLLDIFCVVYDPKTGKSQDVIHGAEQVVRGWLDGGHLLLDDSPQLTEFRPSGKVHYASYDIGAGTLTGITTPAKMPLIHNDLNMGAGDVSVSPKVAYLRLEDESRRLQDAQKVGAVDAHALWVRRTQGPKLQSAAPVGLTPGTDDPQAAWSPNGTQIAFIAHGDLFVTDLTMRDATVTEKYKAGETLTCAEERDLATTDLKQVGLAMLQYCQDYDETFPPADNWQDRVNPYLKDNSLFSAAGHPVVYHTPANLSLASVSSPMDTVLGTIDLPCATVTLYLDGHVKALPKPGQPSDNR